MSPRGKMVMPGEGNMNRWPSHEHRKKNPRDDAVDSSHGALPPTILDETARNGECLQNLAERDLKVHIGTREPNDTNA